MCVCVSVCLSVREDISVTTPIFVHEPMAVARSSSGRMTKSQGEWAFWGIFFLTVSALYSIAFVTDTKTVKPIEMPFGTMTRVGPKYRVLHGAPDPPRGRDRGNHDCPL